MIGAVRYLNMLPYFALGRSLQLFETPQKLNDAMQRGELSAVCTSTLAGLEQGWKLLSPGYGVAAQAEVESVYLEPRNRELVHWDLVQNQNVRLVSQGASKQSLWLATHLLEQMGNNVSIEVHNDPDSVYAPSRSDTEFLLMIGDAALIRRWKDPHRPRWDIAKMWQAAYGLPCVFAAWFIKPGTPSSVAAELSDQISQQLKAFETVLQKTTPERCALDLQLMNPHSLRELIATAPAGALLNYLQKLTFRLDAAHFTTIELYSCKNNLLNISKT